MKYQIMVKILMLLLSRKRVTAKEIAQRYEISLRSVYRYIEELSISGIPVNVAQGRYGGFSIADTFKLPSGYFTREEYAAAINALTAFNEQVGDVAGISALEKLEYQQKSDKRELAVCGNIIVDGGSWGDAGKFSQKMKVCERAVNDCLSLEIDYISREGEHTRRVIDPHVLIFKGNVWYLYAFCHNKQSFRTFKIGRIKQAQYTGGQFVKKPIKKDDIPLDFSYSSEQLIEVVLEIKREYISSVEEWLGIENISPKGNGLIATVTLPDDEFLVGKLLSCGNKVKVLSPAPLKQKIQSAATRILEGYND
jgi:predicted DNA-binding transcriptional regulator YafY